MKYKYEDFDNLEQAKNELVANLHLMNYSTKEYAESLINGEIKEELENENENIPRCNELIEEISNILTKLHKELEHKEDMYDIVGRSIDNEQVMSHLDLGIVEFLYNLSETYGEMSMLSTTIGALRVLMSWCEVCFNNEQEVEDYEKLKKALDILLEVHNNYLTKY